MNEAELTCMMVMELVQTEDLRHYLIKRGNLSEEEVANIVYKLLDCLDYLKEKGVCHRDLKP